MTVAPSKLAGSANDVLKFSTNGCCLRIRLWRL
jgi:hypothetical protein